MYWTIEKKQEKRHANGLSEYGEKCDWYLSGNIRKDPLWVKKNNGFGHICGEKIKREFKYLLTVRLCESKRVNGKPKRKTLFCFTFRYWNIIDSVYGIPESDYYLEFFQRQLSNKLKEPYDHEDGFNVYSDKIESLTDDLRAKLTPYIEEFKADYEQTEEYTWLAKNKALYDSEFIKYFEEQEEIRQAEKKQSYEYQRESKKAQQENYERILDGMKSTSHINPMQEEIIKAGFKVLAKKYHPDVNGEAMTEKFKELENAKSTLLRT